MATIDGYFTLYEAARQLGVSHSQVARYIRERRLRAVNLGRQKLIPEQAIMEFIPPLKGNPAFRRRKPKQE